MFRATSPTVTLRDGRPADPDSPTVPAADGTLAAVVVDDGKAPDVSKSVTTTCTTLSQQERKKVSAVSSSFTKPANWVVIFGAVLAMCAGIVNTAFFLQTGAFVSNHTGHTAKLGMRAQGVQLGEVSHVELQRTALILLSFVFGAFLCGMLIDQNQVHFGGKSAYGLALLWNSCLLLAATYTLPHIGAVYLGAVACGLQNAMCTSHFGAVVRTTHVTGALTDIGSTSGRMVMILLRRQCLKARLTLLERAEFEIDMKKLSVLLPVYFGFVIGCTQGAYLEQALQKYALLVPALITGVTGIVYGCFRQHMEETFKRMEMRRLDQDLGEVQDTLQRAQASLEQIQKRDQARGEDPAAVIPEDGQVVASSQFVTVFRRCESYGDEIVTLSAQLSHALGLAHNMEHAFDRLKSPCTATTMPSEAMSSTVST